jgi:hypothetical protein
MLNSRHYTQLFFTDKFTEEPDLQTQLFGEQLLAGGCEERILFAIMLQPMNSLA